MKGAVVSTSGCVAYLLVEAFKLIWGPIVAVAVNPDGIVESFNVFEDQPVCLLMGFNPETIQPFPLNQGVEGFDAGIIIGITLVAVAKLELLRGFSVSL